MAGCEVGRMRVLVGLIRLVLGNGSVRFAWLRTAGRQRWLVTGVVPLDFGSLAP